MTVLTVNDPALVAVHPDSNGGDPVARGVVTRVYRDRIADPADADAPKLTVDVCNVRVSLDGPSDGYLQGVRIFDSEAAAADWLAVHRKLIPRRRGESGGLEDPDPNDVYRWVQAVYPAPGPASSSPAPEPTPSVPPVK